MNTTTAPQANIGPERPIAYFGKQIIIALAGFLVVSLLAALVVASRWTLVHDAAVMDYVAFLIRHGFAPYREIVDLNMPGGELFPLAQTAIFGSGAAGLLAWVSIEMVAVITASIYIAGPHRRWSGFAAGCLISLVHLSYGAWDLGQRDWDVAVLLLICCAFLVEYLRLGKYPLIAGAFLAGGFAASIKPQAALFPVIGLLYVSAARKGNPKITALAALIGFAVPTLVTALFLEHYHAFGAFLSTGYGLTRYYASLAHPTLRQLAWDHLHFSEKALVIVCLVGLAFYIKQRLWRWPELNLVVLGLAFGVASYYLQNKGFAYHRIPAWTFASLWLLLVIDASLTDGNRRTRFWAWCVVLALMLMCPILLLSERANRYPLNTITHLQSDLERLGGHSLSGEVQCLDMTMGGCVNVLYRLNIKQSTGFIGDFYLFPGEPTPLTSNLQTRFLSEVSRRPPKVIVLSSHIWPGNRFAYDKVNRWPAFRAYLNSQYRMLDEYDPPGWPAYAGYRIYLRR